MKLRSLRFKKPIQRTVVTLFVLAGGIVGLGFVPGRVDGVYLGPSCMCDCSNYTVLRDGRMTLYSTGHTPAQLFARYEFAEDGTCSIYHLPFLHGEAEELIYRIKPRLVFSILEDVDDEKSEWIWRWPSSASVKRLIREQEVEYANMPTPNLIRKTYYDHAFRVTRVEDQVVGNTAR
jgi:hypothetical protein